MKIAFIVYEFPSLSQTFILNQITGLLDRGHEVDIFAASRGVYAKRHADVRKYNLLNRTYYRDIPKNKFFRLVKGLFLIVKNFRKNPRVLLRSLDITKLGRKAATLSALYITVPFLDKGPYDIVHCHFGQNGNLGVFLRDIGFTEGKVITTFHGFDATSYPKIHGKSVYKDLFRKVDKVTVNSNFTMGRLEDLGCPKNKIIKLPVGINTSEFVFKEKTIKPGQDIKILTVARLVEQKGIEYSIRAVAEVLKLHPNVKYNIVGDGPLREHLGRLIAQLGIEDKVKLLGWENQLELRQLYFESHIFILPSIRCNSGDEEGQGLVIQEAQAMGLPVISTIVGGIPESMVDGEFGFLVPQKDISALFERLEYLIEHPEVWSTIGRASRRYVEENFDINKLNDQLVEIYHQAIGHS